MEGGKELERGGKHGGKYFTPGGPRGRVVVPVAIIGCYSEHEEEGREETGYFPQALISLRDILTFIPGVNYPFLEQSWGSRIPQCVSVVEHRPRIPQ